MSRLLKRYFCDVTITTIGRQFVPFLLPIFVTLLSSPSYIGTCLAFAPFPSSINTKNGRFFQSGYNDRTGPCSVPVPVPKPEPKPVPVPVFIAGTGTD